MTPRGKTYRVWYDMVRRCTDFRAKDFKFYGARGITVCEEWKNSFDAFLEDMGPTPEGMRIERKHNDGQYCKANCTWADQRTQCNNKRSNLFLVFGGERLTLEQWAAKIGVKRTTLASRVNRFGWPLRRALTLSEGRGRGSRDTGGRFKVSS